MNIDFISLFVAAVLAGTPLLLGTLGEILTEKSGHLNLGVEGMMFMGAIASIAASWAYEQMAKGAGFAASGFLSMLIALLAAFGAGAFGALIYSFLTVTLRANQNVTGLTLTIFGTGLANFCGELLGKSAGGCRRRRCKCEQAGGRLLGLAAQEGPRRAGTVVRSCSWNHLHANTARMSVYARRIRPSKITCPKGQFIFRDIHTNRRY